MVMHTLQYTNNAIGKDYDYLITMTTCNNEDDKSYTGNRITHILYNFFSNVLDFKNNTNHKYILPLQYRSD